SYYCSSITRSGSYIF
nr:immunoglobulin light chain junction region [Macaca mulatta]MOW02413.1 immunoglobulin light chain junction region [Macaca mulatta]MOW02486.1 immunoglobulin light chain junction region [Macaca mulatta]MOW02565.1 immunoglobulin light chain junction region [Macaca mulatta]MOW02857.1 immunoglobulin light chain junction region [Macaca mulatta]